MSSGGIIGIVVAVIVVILVLLAGIALSRSAILKRKARKRGSFAINREESEVCIINIYHSYKTIDY